MYQIYCDGKLIYDPRDEELSMLSCKVSLEVNATGELDFTLPRCHPAAGTMRKLMSTIQVMDGGGVLYEGRLLKTESDMYGTIKHICEGELSYLLDSIQRPKEYHNLTPRIYLGDKLAQHNSRVDNEKRFTLGIVEKQSMNYDAREDNQYASTLDTILDKLVKSNGGYLRVRKENGIRYLDYLESYGRTSMQTIRFGENILDLTEHISAEDVITVLIPLGKAPEGAAEGEKLTIASVNGGKDYIENTEAIALFGRIEGVKEWQDVTIPANLKAKGEEYLKDMRNMAYTVELTALDLHLVDVDIDRIRLGDMVRVISPPHGLDRYMMVSRREYNLLNPAEDRIILGDTLKALTDKQNEMQKAVQRQNNVQGEIVALGLSVAEVSGTVAQMDGKVQVLEQNYVSLPEQIESIQDSLAKMGADHVADVKALEKKLSEISDRLDSLEKGGTS